MALFGTALLIFFSVIAWSLNDIAPPAATTPATVENKSKTPSTEIAKPTTDLDTGLVALAVKEIIDRQPAESGVLANIMRKQLETAGLRVVDAANTIGVRDAALDARAGIYMTCASRSTSRDETTADGTKQVRVSVTVTVRVYDTSSGGVLAARTKSGRASGPTLSDANVAALQKVIDKLGSDVISALDRFRAKTEEQDVDRKYERKKTNKTDTNVDNPSPLDRKDVSSNQHRSDRRYAKSVHAPSTPALHG